MMWQNPGAQPPPFGLQQAMAAQAAHQQQLQQQQANFQVRAPWFCAAPKHTSCFSVALQSAGAAAGCYAMPMKLHGVRVRD